MAEDMKISLSSGDKEMEFHELGSAIKDALKGQGQPVAAPADWVGDKAVEAVDEALSGVDLMQMLGSAWTTASSLRDRADPAKFPQDKVQYVKLGKHTVTFDSLPSFLVSLGPWTSEPVVLEMPFTAVINAVELKIKGGHIVSARGGNCDLGVAMKFAGKEIMKRRTLRTLAFNAEHKFLAPGLSLRPG